MAEIEAAPSEVFINFDESDEEEDGGVYPPWFRYSSFEASQPLNSLHNEILDLCDLLKQTPEEKRDAQDVVQWMEGIVRGVLGDSAQLHVFGSHLTGLVLPGSDVDMVVMGGSPDGMRKLSVEMRKQSNSATVSDVELVTGAKVPLIKFVHVKSGRDCDICFNQDSSLRTAQMACQMMDDLPTVRPLVMVIKYFLAQRDINDTYSGGIGSFLTQLLVISFIQSRAQMDTKMGRGSQFNLGSLLLEFLQLYGLSGLRADSVMISVRNGGSYLPKNRDFMEPDRPYLLCVENPENPDIDVGRNSYNVEKARRAFELAHCALQREMSKDSRKPRSYLQHIIPLDATLRSRDLPRYPVFKVQDFQKYGAPPPPPPLKAKRGRIDDGAYSDVEEEMYQNRPKKVYRKSM